MDIKMIIIVLLLLLVGIVVAIKVPKLTAKVAELVPGA